jgi:hypothetical protein
MTERLFFVHVKKTGGTTLRWDLIERFEAGEVYPDPRQDPDNIVAYTDVSYLLSLPEARIRRIRAYSGHFPYVAATLMPGPFVTLTVLRDPVERTISYLKQCQALEQFHDQTLEQIYEDPWQYPLAISDYQVRIFALAADDEPLNEMNTIEMDARRLEIAKDNLAEIDVLGLQDRYAEFTAAVARRFGWPLVEPPSRRVGPDGDASRSLRRRIEHDNPADIEFYEYACELYARRRSGRDSGAASQKGRFDDSPSDS